MKKANLLWVDLEMTGLSPEEDEILEVAAVATNWELEVLASYEAGVKVEEKKMARRMVGEFWESQGDLREKLKQRSLGGKELEVVERELLEFLKQNFRGGEKGEVILAGNSIHQDRKFIDKYWPKLAGKLHYRMLDVSAWKVYFEGALGKRFVKPEEHRAFSDILGSIEELKWYKSFLEEKNGIRN